LSQDHLELFFSCLRGRGGFNNNPNVQQLKCSLRRLLLKNATQSHSSSTNCTTLADTSTDLFMSLSSKRQARLIDTDPAVENVSNADDDSFLTMLNASMLSEYQQNVLHYIGGYVVRHMMKKITCPVQFLC
jgi:DNA transposase THAP9